MRLIFVVALAAAIAAPASVQAQRNKRRTYVVTESDCCNRNRFFLEPYAGGLKDAYDIGASDDTGYLLGFHVGYSLGSRTRLIGNLGYSNTENVSSANGLANYWVYDNVWVITTAGGEFDVVPGRTSAALGLQAGVGWRKVDLEGSVGTPLGPPQNDRSFSSYEVLIPSLTVRHRLTQRASLSAAVQDHMFDVLEGPTQHSPALTLGVSFR